MGFKCCAPGCKTGYKNDPNRDPHGPVISMFRFPKETDKNLRAQWIARLPREDYEPTKNSRLCARHFLDSDFRVERSDNNPRRNESINMKYKYLKDDAIPSQWPGCPQNLSKPVSSRSAAKTKNKISHSEEFNTFDDFREKINHKLPEGVTSSSSPDGVSVFRISSTDQPIVKYCVRIRKNFDYEMWCGGIKLSLLDCSDSHLFAAGPRVKSYLHLCDILKYLHSKYSEEDLNTEKQLISNIVLQLENPIFSENVKIQFLKEQLSLLCVPTPHGRRYSMSLLALAVMWQHISPAAYRQMLADDVLTLPSVRRIQQLSSAVTVDLELSSATVSYLKLRLSKLSAKDSAVSLLIDEVHTKKTVEYLNGQVFGIEAGRITSSLLCLMVKSVAGKYSNIVSMSPVSSLNSEQMHIVWKNVLEKLTEIGYKAVLTMTDGLSTNVRFYRECVCGGTLQVSVPHPYDPSSLHFLLFDTIHLFKNFYNNLVNRRRFVCPSFEPGGENFTVEFGHIEQLYQLELGEPVKIAYKLTDKVLHPTKLERSSVQMAKSLFDESTINGLNSRADHGYPEFRGTATYVSIIRNWFNVVNVRNKWAAQKYKDDSRQALYRDDYEGPISYLNRYVYT